MVELILGQVLRFTADAMEAGAAGGPGAVLHDRHGAVDRTKNGKAGAWGHGSSPG